MNQHPEVELAEFTSLRQEIVERLKMQHQVLLLSGTVAAAALPFLPRLADADLHGVFLGLATLYFILAWHYFEQDFLIAHIARYIEQVLRPGLSSVASNDVLGWERFRNGLVFRTRLGATFYTMLTLFRLLPTVGLGIVFMATFYYLKSRGVEAPWTVFEKSALVANIVLAVFMSVVGVIAYIGYRRIVAEGGNEDRTASRKRVKSEGL